MGGGCVWSSGRVQTLVRYRELTEEELTPFSNATQTPTTTQHLQKPLCVPSYTHIVAYIYCKTLDLTCDQGLIDSMQLYLTPV